MAASTVETLLKYKVDAGSVGQAVAFSAAVGSYQKTLDYLEGLRRQDG